MARRALLGLLLVILCAGAGRPSVVRNEIRFPDLPGYVTLKCDLHMHTVFSDGNVWPTVRVDEAWRERLDAIALTEQPFKARVAAIDEVNVLEETLKPGVSSVSFAPFEVKLVRVTFQ